MKIPRPTRVLMLLENCLFPSDDRVRREARALVSAGYFVIVIAPGEKPQPRREVWEGITIYRYRRPKEFSGFLGYIWEYGYSMVAIFLVSLYVFFREGFNIVHANHPPDTFAFIAAFYKLFGKKYVLDHHDLAPDLYEARFRDNAKSAITRVLIVLERFACRIADRVIATNQSYRTVEIERDGVPAERIFIVRNGPDQEEIFKTTRDTTSQQNGKTIIGYVGIMGTQDGVDNLLRAIQHLVFTLGKRDVICLLVGNGNALPELKALSKELGILDYVHFTGWVEGQDLVRNYLNSMDICAAPEPGDIYNRRSTAAKVMEYMAVGKPIVCFDLTEHRFSAQDAALYARSNDIVDFALKLEFLIMHPSEQVRLGNIGLARVHNQLAWQHQTSMLLKLYASLDNRKI
jgi:glycosyltransferase involved in cell wall biosynthesis